eukprot:s2299_g8.t1
MEGTVCRCGTSRSSAALCFDFRFFSFLYQSKYFFKFRSARIQRVSRPHRQPGRSLGAVPEGPSEAKRPISFGNAASPNVAAAEGNEPSKLKSKFSSLSSKSTASSETTMDHLSPTVANMMTGWRSATAVPTINSPLEERYIVTRRLGEGKFGTVSLAVKRGTNQKYAVKVMPAYGDQEMHITKCLSHPHIVRLHETVRSQSSLCLILDLCLGGDLHQWISQRFRKDKDKGPGQYRTPRRSEVATFVWQMLTAVAYLHHHKIAHRDIKPGNLLLEDPSAPMTLKLADFNLACNFRKGQKLSSRCGSLMYLAPEVIHKSYTERCDIWSIGVTFQDLVTGEALWQAQEEPQIEKMILQQKPELRSRHWSSHGEGAKELFCQLTLREDAGRPSATDAVENSWLRRHASPLPDSNRIPLFPLVSFVAPGAVCLAAMAAGMQQSSSAERLDWMYEQSAASVKPDEDTLMNMPINAQKDKDIEDVKNLQNSTAGSLFLCSATKTTEDMVRKLREDPLFQIRRQEHAARESMMTNPLIMAKIQKKQEKEAKKAAKKEKKAAKKEEKALKKAAKAAKKAKDSSSDSEPEPPRAAAREAPLKRPREEEPDLSALGPSSVVVSKRMEHEQRVAKQKEQALASRGLGRRLTEEEKERRVEQMRVDAKKHEKMKDNRIASTEEREKQIEELEAKMRDKSDQKYFRDLRKDAYAGDAEMTMADRLQTQRHRRQKHLNDPLERD